MSGISDNLLRRLRDTLSRCGPFNSNEELRTAFIDSRIELWEKNLPQAASKKTRIDLTIKYLSEKSNSKKENGLVLFLQTLADQIPHNDSCFLEVTNLSKDLESTLTKPVSPLVNEGNSISSLSPKYLLECFDKRFLVQDVKKVYFLMGIGYNDLVGGIGTKLEKSMALIERCQTQERLSELWSIMQEVNPNPNK